MTNKNDLNSNLALEYKRNVSMDNLNHLNQFNEEVYTATLLVRNTRCWVYDRNVTIAKETLLRAIKDVIQKNDDNWYTWLMNWFSFLCLSARKHLRVIYSGNLNTLYSILWFQLHRLWMQFFVFNYRYLVYNLILSEQTYILIDVYLI